MVAQAVSSNGRPVLESAVSPRLIGDASLCTCSRRLSPYDYSTSFHLLRRDSIMDFAKSVKAQCSPFAMPVSRSGAVSCAAPQQGISNIARTVPLSSVETQDANVTYRLSMLFKPILIWCSVHLGRRQHLNPYLKLPMAYGTSFCYTTGPFYHYTWPESY